MVYPIDVALSAAVVPAFMKIDDVAQLWYNERSNYDAKKSVLENVKKGYSKGYEVRPIKQEPKVYWSNSTRAFLRLSIMQIWLRTIREEALVNH